MKLIVGLGNPGQEYCQTRHNIGFMFLEYIVDKNNYGQLTYESKFKGNILSINSNGQKLHFLEPQTFMNLSGESIQKFCHFYKIDISDVIIIYDDISMNFGKTRFRQEGSHGGHNGIKDIIRLFGQEFSRIKIGVGLDRKYQVSDWVLSRFTKEELIDLDTEVFPKVEEMLLEKISS